MFHPVYPTLLPATPRLPLDQTQNRFSSYDAQQLQQVRPPQLSTFTFRSHPSLPPRPPPPPSMGAAYRGREGLSSAYQPPSSNSKARASNLGQGDKHRREGPNGSGMVAGQMRQFGTSRAGGLVGNWSGNPSEMFDGNRPSGSQPRQSRDRHPLPTQEQFYAQFQLASSSNPLPLQPQPSPSQLSSSSLSRSDPRSSRSGNGNGTVSVSGGPHVPQEGQNASSSNAKWQLRSASTGEARGAGSSNWKGNGGSSRGHKKKKRARKNLVLNLADASQTPAGKHSYDFILLVLAVFLKSMNLLSRIL